jgi:hypothetical protein
LIAVNALVLRCERNNGVWTNLGVETTLPAGGEDDKVG